MNYKLIFLQIFIVTIHNSNVLDLKSKIDICEIISYTSFIDGNYSYEINMVVK